MRDVDSSTQDAPDRSSTHIRFSMSDSQSQLAVPPTPLFAIHRDTQIQNTIIERRLGPSAGPPAAQWAG